MRGQPQVTRFYLRTTMANADAPINYAANYYALKAIINGTGNVMTLATAAPITTH